MNLPSDPDERKKIFALIGIGVVFVLYGVFTFVISPVLTKQAQQSVELETLREEIRKAQLTLRATTSSQREDTRNILAIRDKASDFVLLSKLGNYRLGASAIIERHALKSGFEIANVQERPLRHFPKVNDKDREYTFAQYSMMIEANGNLRQLIHFLRMLESGNPYLCVTRIEISSTGAPEKHRMSLDISWPVWADEAVARKLDEQLIGKAGEEGGMSDG